LALIGWEALGTRGSKRHSVIRSANDQVWKTITLDLDTPLPDVAMDGHTHLHVTALWQGRPLGAMVVPSPLDPFPGRFLADALAERFAVTLHRASVESRLIEPVSSTAITSASVIVCTRDRPESLRRCLQSVSSLDADSLEIIVVDNGVSRVAETRAVAEEIGSRYVREPRPGLDRARNRGLQNSSKGIVLYTDDDVEVDPQWARRMVIPFDDPLVMATTGLVLPAALESAARRDAEAASSHSRGYARRVIDGSEVSAVAAGSVGVGASMAFRADFLRAIGGFPEELDAGMPTRTGGDTYALYRVLDAGFRVVYEPSALAYHWHRDSQAAVRRMVRGNGTGILSYLIHLERRDGNRGALIAGGWGASRYLVRKLAKAVLQRPGAPPANLVLLEAAGALEALPAYSEASRITSRRSPVLKGPRRPIAPWLEESWGNGQTDGQRDDLPRLSVVIPSRGRRESLMRLLASLSEQEYPREKLEVIVVLDGDVDGSEGAIRSGSFGFDVRVVVLPPPDDMLAPPGAGRPRNRGASEASGEIVLFLDDDVEPLHRQVLVAHGRAHLESEAVVVGPYPPDLRSTSGLFAQRVRNWWVDHTRRLARESGLTYTDVCTGNLSVPRALFLELGGFRAMPRREDWEFGFRVVAAGVPIRSAPDGGAVHHVDVDLGKGLRDRRAEGAGDVEFARWHPDAFPMLPLARWLDLVAGRRRVRALIAWSHLADPLERWAVPILELVQRLGWKGMFLKLLDRLNTIFYWAGVGDATGGIQGWSELVATSVTRLTETTDFELTAKETWPGAPKGASDIRVTYRGSPVGRLPVRYGGFPWDPELFAIRATHLLSSEIIGVDLSAVSRS
jgi:glycosyltransferase involved in cell wall biosynthesis